jgi:hypothetical protein
MIPFSKGPATPERENHGTMGIFGIREARCIAVIPIDYQFYCGARRLAGHNFINGPTFRISNCFPDAAAHD